MVVFKAALIPAEALFDMFGSYAKRCYRIVRFTLGLQIDAAGKMQHDFTDITRS